MKKGFPFYGAYPGVIIIFWCSKTYSPEKKAWLPVGRVAQAG